MPLCSCVSAPAPKNPKNPGIKTRNWSVEGGAARGRGLARAVHAPSRLVQFGGARMGTHKPRLWVLAPDPLPVKYKRPACIGHSTVPKGNKALPTCETIWLKKAQAPKRGQCTEQEHTRGVAGQRCGPQLLPCSATSSFQ